MSVKLKLLHHSNAVAWDAFVNAMPDASFFHCAAWAGVIEAAFGHQCYHVLAEQDGTITGVLPLAHVRSLLFGNALISTPFCVYGGPLAAEPEAAAALERYADELREKSGASALELRERRKTAGGGITRADVYVTFRKPISGDDETNMKAIPRKQRAMVRKGIQNGLASVCNNDTRVLHRIYAESVRNLGTPVFSHRYFSILTEVFFGCSDIVTVFDDETPIAAVMNFYYRDEVLPYYGGGTLRARQLAGNDFMYWEVMRHAAARGCRMFDFGRSKHGTGSFAFKRNWGFEPEPLHYRYHLAPGAALPNRNPLNPKYQMFIAAWKHLPLAVANLLGPPIVRGLG